MIEKMNKGFTLIELAIVVVVLGILITGIIGGQSLIESAKKREVITGFTQLRTGLNAFKLEFDAIPGDMEDAYDYWGDDCSSREDVCNGNNDKLVADSVFDSWCWGSSCERCMFFKHLGLANLWSSTYECFYNGPWAENNSYRNPLNNESYFFVSNRCKEGITYSNCRQSNHYERSKYYLMSGSTGHNGEKDNWIDCGLKGAIKPKDLKYIDSKLDDGKPKTGLMVASEKSLTSVGCHNSTAVNDRCLLNNTENAYNVANDDYVCQMHYRLDL